MLGHLQGPEEQEGSWLHLKIVALLVVEKYLIE
jgi:hypothetical protein